MSEKYDCIVIGGGISGILSALALTKERKSVLLIEKSDVLGGNCRSYTFGGFQVDTGAHAITGLTKGPIPRFMDQYFDIRPVFLPHGHYYVRDADKLMRFPFTMQSFARFSIVPKIDRAKLMRAFVDAAKVHTTDSDRQDMSVWDFAKPYGFTPKTLRFLNALSFFLTGKSMKETPTWRILSGGGTSDETATGIKHRLSAIRGVIRNNSSASQGYPKGGLRSITNAAIASIPKDRITIKREEPVKKIVKKGTFLVRTNKGTYESDTVVYTAPVISLPMILENPLPEEYRKNLKSLKTCLSLTLWLGLKTPRPEFSYRGSEIFFDTETPFWAMPISNYDPNLAPEGNQLIGFTTYIPEDKDPESQKKGLISTIISQFPGIEKDIVMKHYQIVIPEKAAITADAAFPHPKSPVDGLYLAGTDTDERSMGITRATYSVFEMLDAMKKDKVL